MQQVNPLAAYVGGMQLGEQKQQADRAKAMQGAGTIAAATRGITNPQDFEATKGQLVELGVLDANDAGKYTFDSMPQIQQMVRGIEGQLADERDLRDYQTGVSQWERSFAQSQANKDRTFNAGREDKAQAQDNWLTQFNTAMGKKDKPADEYGRYVAEEQAAGREPLSRIDYAQAKKGKGITVYDPATGKPMLQVGGKADGGKPLTEAQSKSVIYATRARNALSNLDQRDDQLTSFFGHMAGKLGAVGNYAQNPEYQQAKQAADEFLAAILRKDTGAAITSQEFDLYGPMFLPMPGDSAEVLDQKKVARQNAILALEAGMGENERGKVDAAIEKGSQSGQIPNLTLDDVNGMSPEDAAKMLEQLGY